MKAYIPLLSLVILQLCVASCNKDDKNEHICCSSDPVVFTIDSQTYLIPNVITPNGDGINDHFCITPSFGLYINSYRLEALDIPNEPDNNRILCWHLSWPTPNTPTSNRDPGPFGTFAYEIEVENTSGSTKMVSGTFCSTDCENGLLDGDLRNCVFSTLYDPHRGFDPTLPSGENCR